jgi:hypothetical protein
MQFLPKVLVAVLLSLIVAAGGQFMLAEKAHLHGLNVAQLPGWPVLGAWLASTGLLVLLVVRSISRAVHKG